jgi:hypothetical protein
MAGTASGTTQRRKATGTLPTANEWLPMRNHWCLRTNLLTPHELRLKKTVEGLSLAMSFS